MSRRAVLALGAMGTAMAGVVACGGKPEPGPSWNSGAGILPAGQVWAHAVPQGMPLQHDDDVTYGSQRPLAFAPATARYQDLVRSQVAQARAAGITGMQLLLLEGVNSAEDFLRDWMPAAEATGGSGAFVVAPCLQVRTRDGADRLLRDYAGFAGDAPSAGRIGDALVVWVYDAPALEPSEWAGIRQGLDRDGISVVLLGELRTAASQHGGSFDAVTADRYAGIFDAVWLFDDHDALIFEDLATWAREHRTAFAGGIMPGYDRQTDRGGFVDARATQRWRDQWELHLGSEAPWATVVTWNDVVERTGVEPSSDWGTTRSDLTAFYAARTRDEPTPRRRPTAYVTSPQFLVAGHPLLAEGLVINTGDDAVSVRLRVVTGDSRVLARSEPVDCPAGEVGAAVLEEPVRAPAGEAVYAVVEVQDAGGSRIVSTRGAPVVVYAPGDPAVPQPTRRTYYSLSSAGSVPFDDVASFPAGDVEDTDVAALRVTTRRPVRSVELLHNTWPAGLGLDTTTVSYETPPGTIVGGQHVSTPAHGFTVARVITHDGRIAYSAPVHHRQKETP